MKKRFSNQRYFSDMIILFGLLLSCQAYAQEDKIKQLDLDQDGMITIKEAVADPELLAVFGKIDSDGDGKISKIELERAKYIEQNEYVNNQH